MIEEAKLLQDAISIAQTMLRREKDKSKITPALIAEKVKADAATTGTNVLPLKQDKAA